MGDVGFAGLQVDLVDLPFADEGDQAAAGDVGVTPMREALRLLVSCLFPWVICGGCMGAEWRRCTILRLTVGRTESECPVHASSPCRCATIQSTVPSRWTTAKEVMADLVAIRAVSGVVEEI